MVFLTVARMFYASKFPSNPSSPEFPSKNGDLIHLPSNKLVSSLAIEELGRELESYAGLQSSIKKSYTKQPPQGDNIQYFIYLLLTTDCSDATEKVDWRELDPEQAKAEAVTRCKDVHATMRKKLQEKEGHWSSDILKERANKSNIYPPI